jgi:hypothetical protein
MFSAREDWKASRQTLFVSAILDEEFIARPFSVKHGYQRLPGGVSTFVFLEGSYHR